MAILTLCVIEGKGHQVTVKCSLVPPGCIYYYVVRSYNVDVFLFRYYRTGKLIFMLLTSVKVS